MFSIDFFYHYADKTVKNTINQRVIKWQIKEKKQTNLIGSISNNTTRKLENSDA